MLNKDVGKKIIYILAKHCVILRAVGSSDIPNEKAFYHKNQDARRGKASETEILALVSVHCCRRCLPRKVKHCGECHGKGYEKRITIYQRRWTRVISRKTKMKSVDCGVAAGATGDHCRYPPYPEVKSSACLLLLLLRSLKGKEKERKTLQERKSFFLRYTVFWDVRVHIAYTRMLHTYVLYYFYFLSQIKMYLSYALSWYMSHE